MTNTLSQVASKVKNWWLFLILGILLTLGGIWVAQTPLQSYLALAALFIVLLIVNGIMQIIFAISNKGSVQGWGWFLAGGIMEFLIGVYLWANPGISAAMLPFVVAFWLLFRGISIIANSTDLKEKGTKGWGWLLTSGILMTIISFFMLLDPVFGYFNVIFLTAFAMIFMGISYTILSFKLKSIKSKAEDILAKGNGGVEDLKKAVMEHLKNSDPKIQNKVNKMFDDYMEKK